MKDVFLFFLKTKINKHLFEQVHKKSVFENILLALPRFTTAVGSDFAVSLT